MLETGYSYEVPFRYSELKKFHESFETLKVKIPKFPATSWFHDVNSDTNRIETRLSELDTYFKSVCAIKEVRESFLFKNFIRDAKLKKDERDFKDQKQHVKFGKKILFKET